MSDNDKIQTIEQDMARSRAEIERTAEELKSRVNRDNLAETARQAILESTQRVEEKVKELAGSAGGRVEDMGAQAAQYFHHNPMPALVAGLGLGLLIAMAERQNTRSNLELYGTAEPGRFTSALSRRPALMKAQRRTVRQARRLNRKHPLMLGAAVFGVGLLLGSLIPNTRREDELMGASRDRLLESGKENAQIAVEQAKSAMTQELEQKKIEAAELREQVEVNAMRAFHDARMQSLGANPNFPTA